MQVKRIYDHSGDVPMVKHLKFLIPPKPVQKFTRRFLDKGMEEGWLLIGGGRFVIKGDSGDVVYKIVRKPGLYCCHDNQPLPDQIAARAYVAEHFAGVESPDANHPSGYRNDDFFYCELEG